MIDNKEKRAMAIAEAARPKQHPVIPVYYLEADDGKSYSPWGFPDHLGIKPTGGRVLHHYAYRDIKNGTTFGRMAKTAVELENEQKARGDGVVSDFYAKLMDMDDDRFISQEEYWKNSFSYNRNILLEEALA